MRTSIPGMGGCSLIVALKSPKSAGLLRTGRCDPCPQRVDDMQFELSAERLIHAAADALRDKGREFFKWRHRASPSAAYPLPACISARSRCVAGASSVRSARITTP